MFGSSGIGELVFVFLVLAVMELTNVASFMKNVYTAFSFGDNAVGFAALK